MLNSAVLGLTLKPALRTLGLALFIGVALASRTAFGDGLKEANKLLKAGDYSQALNRVEKILASQPNDPQARFLKGVILTEEGNDKDAVVVFRKLTRDYPELPEPYNNLAVIYASHGEYEKAREALEESIRTHPSYATAYENLGDVYATLAGRAYDKALQIDSTDSNTQHKLALLRRLIGGPPGSIKEARHVAVASVQQSAPAERGRGEAKQVRPSAPVHPEVKPAEAKPAPIKPEPAKHTAVAEAKPAPIKPEPAKHTAVAEAKPAAARPAVPEKSAHRSAATRAASEAQAKRAILATVERWAHAWSRRDVGAYLAFYAKNFETPHGRSRESWEKLRRERLTAPKSISVTVASPRVHMAANGTASVTFRQSYRSNILRSSTTKTLVLEQSGGRWLIRQERIGH